MSVQGNIKPVRSLVELLQIAKDNGAKRALIPIENKRSFLEVDADIVEHCRPNLLRRSQDSCPQGPGHLLAVSVAGRGGSYVRGQRRSSGRRIGPGP